MVYKCFDKRLLMVSLLLVGSKALATRYTSAIKIKNMSNNVLDGKIQKQIIRIVEKRNVH